MSLEQKHQKIIDAIQEKKGHQIITIDLSQIENSICDCFIICHGESVTQVGAITQSIEKKMKEGDNPRNAKVRLAKEIVTLYHNEKAANDAEQAFRPL